MMKALQVTARLMAVLLLTYFFAQLWLRSWGSERFWTWLNSLISDGTNPGLASDIELLIVLAVALAAAVVVVLCSLRLWQQATRRGGD